MNRTARSVRDGGASNVVGFILITGIALITVSIVFIGGTPVLEQLQASKESEAIEGYMIDLDQSVNGLLTGSPRSTTPSWRFAMASGSMALNDTEIWAFAVDTGAADTTIEWGSFHDGDNVLAYDVGSTTDPASWEATRYSGAWSESLTATASSGTLTLSGGSDNTLSGDTIRIVARDSGGAIVHEAWFIDGGAIVWSSGSGASLRQVAYENGAVIAREPTGQLIVQGPKFKPPRESSEDGKSVFLRVLKFNGSASYAGQTSTTVLLSSWGNHGRYSSADIERVSIYPADMFVEAWKTRLTDTNRGWSYSNGGNPETGVTSTAGNGPWYVYHDVSEDPDASTLSASLVETGIELGAD